MRQDLLTTLTTKLELAKVKTMEQLFKEFCDAKTDLERENIANEVKVLTKLTRRFTKVIKETVE